jgi:hypothetical protein
VRTKKDEHEEDKRRRPEVTVRRSGRIPDAVAYSGFSRTTLYELSRQHVGLFKKYGSATLVDYTILNAIIDSLPSK